MKRYLVQPLHDQVNTESARLQATVIQEVREATASLGRLRAEITASLGRLQAEMTASLGRDNAELAASLERLQAEMAAAHASSSDDLRLALEYSAAAARRVAVPDGDGKTLIRARVGYVLVAATDHALVGALVESGELEPGTREVIENTLQLGDVFVDVGANIGLHTIAAGRKVGPTGKVLAFEPFAPTVALLERSVWINGLSDITTIFPVALDARAGSHELFLGGTSGHHSFYPLDGSEGLAADTVKVTTTTLDAAVGSRGRVDLIKIDAEGAELDVLEGARKTLKANPDLVLIVELGTSHLARSGTSLSAWLGAFAAAGFEPHIIDEITGAVSVADQASLKDTVSVNLFFAPPGSAALDRQRR